MALEIKGTLQSIGVITTGTGKTDWKKRDFVIETTSDKYTKKICFSAWGDKAEEIENYPNGTELNVSFEVSSREYNSKWYTDLRAWKIDVLAEYVSKAEALPTIADFKEDNSDLPF